MGSGNAHSIKDIAKIFTDDHFEELAGGEKRGPDHAAVNLADTFTEVVKSVVGDKTLGQDDKRRAVALALTAMMDRMDSALPTEQAAKINDAPVWAQELFKQVQTLETRLSQQSVNVNAGSVTGTSPDNMDTATPTIPARKSQAPEIRASKAVSEPMTFRDIALTLCGFSNDGPRLP